jgi:type I restriction enzyme M protein
MLHKNACRFYSPGWLGSALVGCLPTRQPSSIVDLGTGMGALAQAASRRWATAPLVTVDIDAAPDLPDSRNRRHVLADALDARLADRIGVAPSSVDLVLSNPPYRRSQWHPRFRTILERAGFGEALRGLKGVPTDLVFLAQAMHLVRPGGTLGFIVPDTMIAGTSMAPVREALLSKHAVQRVIQAPRGAFKGTDAQTFILVIGKQREPTRVRLDRIDLSGVWSEPIEIAPEAGVERLDFSFHCGTKVRGRPERSLSALGGEVSRGRASSVEVAVSRGAIFHTCDFPDRPGGHVVLNGSASASDDVPQWWAKTGDILVARVDRRLEDKVAFVIEGAGPISDCVLRLRVPAALRVPTLDCLVSPEGRRQLTRHAHGTGARHISASSLLQLEI